MTAPATKEAPSGFEGLGVDARLLAGLAALGYEEPTPIQERAIPPLLAGKDVRGLAATGTGKTAAFALPLLQRLPPGKRARGKIAALVLVPTRELAIQVAEAIHRYGAPLGTSVLPIYGGQSMPLQLRALERGVDVVVATPGRALDHIRRATLDLSGVGTAVLDEADEMLDMGFAEDLDAILAALPAERQTALFSATMSPRILSIAKRHQKAPVDVTVEKKRSEPGSLPKVRQTAYIVMRAQKLTALARVLDMEEPTSVMVFCRTRIEVDELTERLGGHGFSATAIHGGLSQEQRDRVMRKFRSGKAEVLVATDVAARGLDIEHVSHVVNYDVPSAPEAYVHRIGRTGRAGRAGVAITLAEPREHRQLRVIEQLTKTRIEIASLPTLADLRAKRLELLQSQVKESLTASDLDRYRAIAASLASEHDVLDVAAAALRTAHLERGGEPEGEDVAPPPPRAPRFEPRFEPRDGPRFAARPSGPRDGGPFRRTETPPAREERAPARGSPSRAGDAPTRTPPARDDRAPARTAPSRDERPIAAGPPREGVERPREDRPPDDRPAPRATTPPPESRRFSARVPRAVVEEDAPPPRAKAPRDLSRGIARIQIGCGKKDGIRPGDLVGAIANEAGVPSSVIGAIEIQHHASVVEVSEDAADQIVRALAKAKVKGRRVSVRRAE